jgi:hypothetical protein
MEGRTDPKRLLKVCGAIENELELKTADSEVLLHLRPALKCHLR